MQTTNHQTIDVPGARPIRYVWTQGGGVPGGHNVIFRNSKPFIPPTSEMAAVSLRHSDVVVDVGAYVGTYALRCARFPVKQVHAYEPTPASAAVLRLSPHPVLTVHEAAVMRKSGTATLRVSKGIGVTNSLLPKRDAADCIKVPTVAYAEAVRDATVVKIDVEGGEYDLIGQLVQPKLRAVLLDFHAVSGMAWQTMARMLIGELEAAGFVALIEPNFAQGWRRAGAWVRDMPDDGTGYQPMLKGEQCCGCGTATNCESRCLCAGCWATWLPRHRKGYLESAC